MCIIFTCIYVFVVCGFKHKASILQGANKPSFKQLKRDELIHNSLLEDKRIVKGFC